MCDLSSRCTQLAALPVVSSVGGETGPQKCRGGELQSYTLAQLDEEELWILMIPAMSRGAECIDIEVAMVTWCSAEFEPGVSEQCQESKRMYRLNALHSQQTR
jgi:hypothetical protein